jgi:hypothetical protein
MLSAFETLSSLCESPKAIHLTRLQYGLAVLSGDDAPLYEYLARYDGNHEDMAVCLVLVAIQLRKEIPKLRPFINIDGLKSASQELLGTEERTKFLDELSREFFENGLSSFPFCFSFSFDSF